MAPRPARRTPQAGKNGRQIHDYADTYRNAWPVD
jgi:hypothetical protein